MIMIIDIMVIIALKGFGSQFLHIRAELFVQWSYHPEFAVCEENKPAKFAGRV